MKICPCCQKECKEDDFIMSDECFHCVYKKKGKNKIRRCEMCKVEIDSKHWVYCSDDCSKKAQRIKRDAYWVRKISYNPKPWNPR